MSNGLNIAASGMMALQHRLDIIANNVANVNTNGYKRNRAEFCDLVYSSLQGTHLANPAGVSLQIGAGSKIASSQKDFSAGSLMESGRALDVALAEGTFYAAMDATGQITYSEDGMLASQERDGWHYLVTGNNHTVLDLDGEMITSPEPLTEAKIQRDGSVIVNGLPVGTIGTYTFANKEGLKSVGQKTYEMTAASGEAEVVEGSFRQGFIELSNVDLSEEMTSLIRTQRLYALLSRALTTVDQMKATAQDIRR